MSRNQLSDNHDRTSGPAAMPRGLLMVVGTPIGNLADWSARAADALRSAGLIACEDTRRTGSLLARHDITNPGMVVMNEHTEVDAATRVVRELDAGVRVAIVSDAGMPTISDPGALVVAAAVDAGHDVVVIPGPTAVSAALALTGFTAGRYVFEGFLPRKGRARVARIDALADEPRMIVLYEAPHRIERTLDDLSAALDPDRGVVIARELTKLHEAVWRGPLHAARSALGDPRGEYVIVVDAAAPAAEPTDAELLDALAAARADGCSNRDAVARVVAETGVTRNRVYSLATDASR